MDLLRSKQLSIIALFGICTIFSNVLLAQSESTSTSSTAPITTNDLATSPTGLPADPASDATHAELVNYAWRLFISLNVEASATRGEPDAGSTFIGTGGSSETSGPLVWETFYHRTEAYPYYDYANNGSTPTAPVKPAMPSSSTSTLPTYYFTDLTVDDGQWNNLDENNQIGQNSIYFPKGGVAHPGTPADDSMVLFQAKVNQQELDYVYPKGPQAFSKGVFSPAASFPDNTVEIKSAWRLADDIPTADRGRYHISDANYYTMGEDETPVANTGQFALIALHIILKTANHPTFMFTSFEQVDSITDAGGSATGLYYIPSYSCLDYVNGSSAPITGHNECDLLAGQPGQTPSATFTGATTSIKATNVGADTITTMALPAGGLVPSYTTIFQPKTITQAAAVVNQSVHGLLPSGNVWQYYSLKGVQSYYSNTMASGTGSSATRVGDPTSPDYYLANIVVESSEPGVQLFKGGAPGPYTNQKTGYSQLGPSRDVANVSYPSLNSTAPDAAMVNIGGCNGCHGDAQQQGKGFAFVYKGIGALDVSTGKAKKIGFEPDTFNENLTLLQARASVLESDRKVNQE